MFEINAGRQVASEAFDLKEGTLYPALHRLERAGKLESTRSRASGRERRVYSLTPLGEQALQEERVAWTTFARGMRGVLGGSG